MQCTSRKCAVREFELLIPRVAWMHGHGRQPPGWEVHGQVNMRDIIHYELAVSGTALYMPNSIPSLRRSEQAIAYGGAVKEFWRKGGYSDVLDLLMTVKLVQTDERTTTPDDVDEAIGNGIFDFKLFPRQTPKKNGGVGVGPQSSTNTEDGVYDIQTLFPAFRRIEQREGRFHWHLENADEPNLLLREFAALKWLDDLAYEFPQLTIIVEHVSDRRTFAVAAKHKNVWVGVTAHHLWGTYDDVQRDPHARCAPVMKGLDDRDACVWNAINNGKCFFTPDSAAHGEAAKVNPGKEPANGCFTAPCAVPLVVTKFEAEGALNMLPEFLTHRGRRLHGFPPEMRTIKVVRKPFRIPERCAGDIIPYMAGEELPWTVEL